MNAMTYYRGFRATEERRGAAASNFTVDARHSDKITVVEVTRHCPLVLLVKIMLETRQIVEKLRRKRDRKGTVGHLQQGKLGNCVFGGQHYDEILIKSRGLHRERNVWS